MNKSKSTRFKEIQEIVNKLNLLLDKELKRLEAGECESDETVQDITSLIDKGLSSQLEILGYVKRDGSK
ncbi:hypothetical protein P4544_17740 [Halomonas sp. LY9]